MNLSWDLGRKVVPVVHKTSAPSGTDTAYNVPTLWLDDTANVAYLLVDITSGTATWRQLQTNVSNMTTATDPAANAATTAAIVAAYSGTIITTTAAGNSQTLAPPSVTTAGRTFMVINNDTSTHSIPVVANGFTFTITPGEAQMFIWDGSAWGPTDLGITDIPVKVVQGGTGASTLTDHGVLLGSGTDPITAMTALAAGELLVGVGSADPHALAAGATTTILVGGGAADPVWTEATGSGAPVRATSPTLVTPVLGTPASGDLQNCTGYPTASNVETATGADTAKIVTPDDLKFVLGHDYTYPIQEIVEYSRAQNCPTLLVEAFLSTPSSANLKAAVSDETGSGALVFADTPTLVTPLLGTPTSGDLRNCTGPTTTTKGAVELDTDAEAVTGEDTERALTAANLKAVLGHDYTYPIQEIVEYSEAQ